MKRLAVVLAVVSGCASTSLQDSFRGAGGSAEVASALSRARPASGIVNGLGRPIAALVVAGTGPEQVVAFDLEARRALWAERDRVGSRLAITAAAVVYAREDGSLVGRDVRDGRLLWQKAPRTGSRRLGMSADSDGVYDLVRGPEGRSLLSGYDAATGRGRFNLVLEGDTGAPAAYGGIVAVPRLSQYVSLVDGKSGRMLAHILSRQEAATFVRALPEGLFFGSRGIYLASGETAAGGREAGYLQPKLPEFVRAFYHYDAYHPEQGDHSAVDRNRVLWRVTANGAQAAFEDGAVVVHSFRFFFGVDAATGQLRWAYSHPRVDAMSSDRTSGQVWFAAADGEVGAIDVRTGARTYKAALPGSVMGAESVEGATFDAEGWRPGGAAEPALPLARALATILWDPDRRFGQVKLFAIDQLARQPEKEVTGELLRAIEGKELPPPVIERAVEALVERKDPSSIGLYVQALKVHADYADDREAPNLAVLAKAVTALKAREALEPLLDHLRRPETSPAAVKDVAAAALAIADAEAVPPFKDYVLQYRADSAFLKDPGGLVAAAEVVLRLGGPSERAFLLFVADEAKTIEPLRAYLRRALFTATATR